MKTTAIPSGTITRGATDGVGSPTIGLTYRALSQKQGPVVLDFSVNYSADPSAFTSDGADGTGRQVVGGSVSLGRAMRRLSVQASVGATHRSDRRQISTGNKSDTEQYASWNYNLSLTTQIHFTDEFSTDAAISYDRPDPRHNIDHIKSITWTSNQSKKLSVRLGGSYQLIPRRLSGSLAYTHQFKSDASEIYLNPISDTQIRNASANIVGLKLHYALN